MKDVIKGINKLYSNQLHTFSLIQKQPVDTASSLIWPDNYMASNKIPSSLHLQNEHHMQ